MDTNKFRSLLNRLEGYVIGLEKTDDSSDANLLLDRFESLVQRAEGAQPGAGAAISQSVSVPVTAV